MSKRGCIDKGVVWKGRVQKEVVAGKIAAEGSVASLVKSSGDFFFVSGICSYENFETK